MSTELEALLPNWECDQIRIEPCPPALICMKMSHLINEAVSQNAQRSAEFYNLVSSEGRIVVVVVMARVRGSFPPAARHMDAKPYIPPFPNNSQHTPPKQYMEQLVGELVNCLGMAERILLTPVPASYSRHTSRFLSLYMLTLPFVLVQQLGVFTVPAIAALCWGLFSIEEIGHLIEEPFSASTNQLPLDRMTRTIGRDVRRLLRVPDDEGVQMHAPWVDEELLSAEDREFAEMAPRPFPSVAAPASSSAGVHDGGGGVVLASVAAAGGAGAGGRNDTLTAASAAMQLRSTETLNI